MALNTRKYAICVGSKHTVIGASYKYSKFNTHSYQSASDKVWENKQETFSHTCFSDDYRPQKNC